MTEKLLSFEQVRTRLNKIWKWEWDQNGREVLIAGKIFTAQAGLGFGFRPPPPPSCPSPAAGRGWGRGDSAHPVGPPIAQSHLCTSVRAYAQQRAVAFVTEHSSFEGVLGLSFTNLGFSDVPPVSRSRKKTTNTSGTEEVIKVAETHRGRTTTTRRARTLRSCSRKAKQ